MIMDGNKRWAKIKGVSLKEGYQNGLNKLREIIFICPSFIAIHDHSNMINFIR